MSRPWISCNLAISADGKISSPEHRPATWTSKADHDRLLALRRPADALMVGRGTADTDNMTMTVPGKNQQPLRCIVSRHADISPEHAVFQREGGDIHLLATESSKAPQGIPATVHQMSLQDFLSKLAQDHGVSHLHCEGGGKLIHALAELDAIDELHLTWAGHTLLGGASSPTLTGTLGKHLSASTRFRLKQFLPQEQTGECFLSYRRAGA